MNTINNEQEFAAKNVTNEKIHDFVTAKGGAVTFIEITEEFGKGEYEYSTEGNMVYWRGLTAETCDCIISLVAQHRIMMYPTDEYVYLVDGVHVKLPVAHRPPKAGYKSPHWLPVVLWTIEQVKDRMAKNLMLRKPSWRKLYREAGYDI